MDLLYKEALRLTLVALSDKLEMDEVRERLFQAGKLTSAAMQKLTKATNTQYQNNSATVEWLRKQPYSTYVVFKNALGDSDNQQCLIDLNKGEAKAYLEAELQLYPNIKQTDGVLENLKNLKIKLTTKFAGDPDVYHCNPLELIKGVALIINNVKFIDLDRRLGSDVDCANLSQLLSQLGYTCHVKQNFTSIQMLAAMDEFRRLPDHKNADSAVVVVLSHGELGSVYGTDDQPVKLETLKQKLNIDQCPELKEKPKLFFIQACRQKPTQTKQEVQADAVAEGENFGNLPELAQSDAAYFRRAEKEVKRFLASGNEMTEADGGANIHRDADFLMAYSTTPGYLSWRDLEHGTWFVQALCQVMAVHAHENNILELLTKVNNRIQDAMGSQTRQISEQCHSLRKSFYFLRNPTETTANNSQ